MHAASSREPQASRTLRDGSSRAAPDACGSRWYCSARAAAAPRCKTVRACADEEEAARARRAAAAERQVKSATARCCQRDSIRRAIFPRRRAPRTRLFRQMCNVLLPQRKEERRAICTVYDTLGAAREARRCAAYRGASKRRPRCAAL